MKESRKTRKPTSSKTVEPSTTWFNVSARSDDADSEGLTDATKIYLPVGSLLLLGIVILAVLWFRRRSARTSNENEKGSNELSIYCRKIV